MSGRKVLIRRDECGLWVWHCRLCEPPCHGATASWAKTLRNVERHCTETRRCHHAFVAKRFGGLDLRTAS